MGSWSWVQTGPGVSGGNVQWEQADGRDRCVLRMGAGTRSHRWHFWEERCAPVAGVKSAGGSDDSEKAGNLEAEGNEPRVPARGPTPVSFKNIILAKRPKSNYHTAKNR